MNVVRNQPEGVANRLHLSEPALNDIAGTLFQWHIDGDAGMQFALYKEGELAIELALGFDPFTKANIDPDTLFCILSTTKALGAMVMLLLHDKGYFEWTDQIADYWPRFGQHGKSEATIEHLMSHSVGIPHLTAPWELWTNQRAMAELVENSEPLWRPGTQHEYHGGIYGTMLNELVLRWTGRSPGEILRENIVEPSGFQHCYMGVNQAELRRLAKLTFLESIPVDRLDGPVVSKDFPPWGDNTFYNSDLVLSTCQIGRA